MLSFDCKGKTKWLMVKRPNDGLLASQWEFPSVVVSSLVGKATEVVEEKRAELLDSFLKDICTDAPNFVIEGIRSSREQLVEPVEHIFSHVRHTSWIEYKNASLSAKIDESSPLKWTAFELLRKPQEVSLMSAEDMKSVGITAEVKKILNYVTKESSRRSTPSKKKSDKKGKNRKL